MSTRTITTFYGLFITFYCCEERLHNRVVTLPSETKLRQYEERKQFQTGHPER